MTLIIWTLPLSAFCMVRRAPRMAAMPCLAYCPSGRRHLPERRCYAPGWSTAWPTTCGRRCPGTTGNMPSAWATGIPGAGSRTNSRMPGPIPTTADSSAGAGTGSSRNGGACPTSCRRACRRKAALPTAFRRTVSSNRSATTTRAVTAASPSWKVLSCGIWERRCRWTALPRSNSWPTACAWTRTIRPAASLPCSRGS